MKPKVLVMPVSGGPEGRSYVRLEQSVRKRPTKYRPIHLAVAYAAGLATAVGVAVAMLAGN